MSYLFGNILMITPGQLWLLFALDLGVIAAGVLLYNPLVAVCFDEEFARIRGLPADLLFILLLVITALTVVLLTTVVGLVLVLALLTLPPAVAGMLTHRLWKMMLLSTGLCSLFVVAGLALSYEPGLPAGATIVLVAGGTYVLSLLGRGLYRRRLPAAR